MACRQAQAFSTKNDRKEGIGNAYYENGALREENPYKNDKQEGQVKSYLENGKLFAAIEYRNGYPVSGKCAGSSAPWTNAELNNWDNGIEVECGARR